MITSAGTFLALLTGLLPQWKAEKYSCRENSYKIVAITSGNGSRYVMVVLGQGRALDLEDLAAGEGPRVRRAWEKHGLFVKRRVVEGQKPAQQIPPEGVPKATPGMAAASHTVAATDDDGNTSESCEPRLSKQEKEQLPRIECTVAMYQGLPLDLWLTRLVCISLFAGWIALLISVVALEEHAWYLLLVGFIGMVQNIYVANMDREPSQRGLHLRKVHSESMGKVMDVIMDIESAYPGKNIGPSLRDEFFPGPLKSPDEIEWWKEGGDKSQYNEKRLKEHWRGVPFSRRANKGAATSGNSALEGNIVKNGNAVSASS